MRNMERKIAVLNNRSMANSVKLDKQQLLNLEIYALKENNKILEKNVAKLQVGFLIVLALDVVTTALYFWAVGS